jgi:hypothetical protein
LSGTSIAFEAIKSPVPFMSDCQLSFSDGDHDLAVTAIAQIHALLRRAEDVDLRAAEADKSEAAHESLLTTIVSLVNDMYALVCQVAAFFEEGRPGDQAALDVADIATMAGVTLQERRVLLAHQQPCNHWTFIENCERTVRRAVKSGFAVECALARYAGLPMRTNRGDDLDAALSIRRRYAILRRDVSGFSAQHETVPRLRGGSRSIAALLACDEYASMRIGDRRELRMLLFRIQSWLSSEHPPASLGERLWEEVSTVVNLLRGVNKRSELVSHDGAALTALFDAVRQNAAAGALRNLAAPLFGLDPELDNLLERGESSGEERERWESVVSTLVHEKGVLPPRIVPAGVPDRAPERTKSID